jgi:hypothetical protein
MFSAPPPSGHLPGGHPSGGYLAPPTPPPLPMPPKLPNGADYSGLLRPPPLPPPLPQPPPLPLPPALPTGKGFGGPRQLDRPRLMAPNPPRLPATVAIVSGLPWFFTENDAKHHLSQFGILRVVRFYEDPMNGTSRGILLVQYEEQGSVAELARLLQEVGPYPVKVDLYHFHLADLWDKQGRLPDLPGDSAAGGIVAALRPKQGFGGQGYTIRGVRLGLPNTVSADGVQRLERIRKRLREAAGEEEADGVQDEADGAVAFDEEGGEIEPEA